MIYNRNIMKGSKVNFSLICYLYCYLFAGIIESSKAVATNSKDNGSFRTPKSPLKQNREPMPKRYVLRSGKYIPETQIVDQCASGPVRRGPKRRLRSIEGKDQHHHLKSKDEDSVASDELMEFLKDPEVGLPTDEELDEIYDRYRRGLPLNFRQSVWLDATSDFTCRGPVDLKVVMPAKNDTSWMDDNSTDLKKRREWPELCHRRLMGCGDMANCSYCRVRYKGVEFLTPDDPRSHLTEPEFTAMRKQGFQEFARRVDEVCAADEDDPFWTQNDTESSQEGEKNGEELEYEARNTVMQRLVSAKLVSDDQLRYALGVLNPHRKKDRRYSRKELKELVTKLRKRMMRATGALDAVSEGDVLEARVLRVRPYGAVLCFPALEEQPYVKGLHGLLHLSQVPAPRAASAVGWPGTRAVGCG